MLAHKGGYARLKRVDLRLQRNVFTVLTDFTLSMIEFQRVGAATEKDLEIKYLFYIWNSVVVEPHTCRPFLAAHRLITKC